MKYAETIRDIPNAFDPKGLRLDELDPYYYNGTMAARTGDEYMSPIDEIFEECLNSTGNNTYLLLGNRGCGKSTELSALSERLMQAGFAVETVQCGMDLDLTDPVYPDLLFLVGEALFGIADRLGCKLDPKSIHAIRDFWDKVEHTVTDTDGSGLKVSAGVSSKASVLPGSLLKLFAETKGDIRVSEENRKVIRKQIRKNQSDWMSDLNAIAGKIAERLDGKPPVIIFEDLDKLTSGEVWKVFYDNAPKLSGFDFPVIYTFQSAFSYDRRFAPLDLYFNIKTFPMIQLEDIDGTPYEAGYDAIMKIIERRSRLDLFEGGTEKTGVLRFMMEKTGGSLRDLFSAINTASMRACTRGSGQIGTGVTADQKPPDPAGRQAAL